MVEQGHRAMSNPKEGKYLQPWSPAIYRNETGGLLEENWSDRFVDMKITSRMRADQSVVTWLSGRVLDRSQLNDLALNSDPST